MSKIERFEDLECWKSARQLMKLVMEACKQGELRRDFDIRSQLKSAALSSMNNIAEGFGRHGNREFIRFLDISQSSCIEVKSMTYVLEDADYLSSDKVQLMRKKAEETKSITLGLIRYLRKKS
jgi:four helix bundle protein